MFYSHEILTSRKHGVATIWLMATLGSKSTHKKVTRNAINGVDVPKACVTITEPEVPLALRLQGSLLVGVSRVFKQQCEYMKLDLDNLAVRLRDIAHRTRGVDIDIEPEVARAEHLNLTNDPAFNIDVDIGFDLSMFDFPRDNQTRADTSTSTDRVFSQSSLRVQDDVPDDQMWLLPASTHENSAGLLSSAFTNDAGFGFDLASNHRSSLSRGEQAIYNDPEILIDNDGALIFPAASDITSPQLPLPDAVDVSAVGAVLPSIEEGADNILVQDKVEPHTASVDDGNQFFMDDDEMAARPLPSTDDAAGAEEAMVEDQNGPAGSDARQSEAVRTTAPQRRRKPKKALQPDTVMELSNRQLSDWSSHYLDNVAQVGTAKFYRQSVAQAKRNAAFWVMDQGIGGVEVNFGEDVEPHPLSIFSGKALFDLLQGHTLVRKRSLSVSSTSEHESRARDRHMSREAEISHRFDQAGIVGEDDGLFPMPEDDQPEVEVGRQAPSSMKDHSSQMPWNISSRQGSFRLYSGALQRPSSLFGGSAGFDLGPPSDLPRYRTRLTSASPLMGRGRPLSRSESSEHHAYDDLAFGFDSFSNLDRELAGDLNDDFELYGPAAAVSTQEAAQSQWLSNVLETEAQNFLSFLAANIQARADQNQDQASDEAIDVITFAELLPTGHNSHIVAAQGFLHVLSLATKDLIRVDQQQDFGDLTLKIVQVSTSGVGGSEGVSNIV